MNSESDASIGAYRLVRRCGGGAYGEVFVAENTLTGERVALKRLFPSPKTLERELAGLIRWRECRHPNLIRIRHVERTRDAFYYTMDLADDLNAGKGEYLPDTLANRLERSGRLPSAEVEKLAATLSDALDFLHGKGLIHRDVKPDNILWINGVPTLGDAGLTAAARGGSLAGTPEFMPDEVLRKKRSAIPEDDFYALRLVLYCAFTGEAPGEFPRCPAGLIDDGNAALWRRILEPAEPPPSGRRKSRRARYFTLTAAAILLALAVAAVLALRPRQAARTEAPAPTANGLPELLERYREDDPWDRLFPASRGFVMMQDYNARADLLSFRLAFGHITQEEFETELDKLDRRLETWRERDAFTLLTECQQRIAAQLELVRTTPEPAPEELEKLRGLLEERRALLRRLEADQSAPDETVPSAPFSWDVSEELRAEAPRHCWGVAAQDPKLKAFYERHRAELRAAAATLPEGGDPAELKKRLEELTAKYSGEEKPLYAISLLHAKYIDGPARRERRIGHSPENYRFYAGLFRINRELVERLRREYPQYRP